MVEFNKIAEHWQKKWAEHKLFEADADPSKKKFFLTFPYPYINGYTHVGHTYTLMRNEALARFKRMQGFNVLFPQAWHATGSPIDTAAKRVAEGEENQINSLKLMGFSDAEIQKFKEPEHWIKVFSQSWTEDFKAFGISVDWRRNFITTDLNPRYSKFIQWQFIKLQSKKLVQQGEHPVVWCPKENTPVGDHARSEGEGVTPEQMVLIKFKLGDLILPAATYRPETTFGVTNMWLNPDMDYIEATVDDETWLIAEPALIKLKDQKHAVEEKRRVAGKTLIGKNCINPVTKNQVPILPAPFVSPETGTGVVMSVPSHAPYDYIALRDIQQKPTEAGVTEALVKDIKPISLIAVEGYGEHPAVEVVERMNIKNQQEEVKLEEATTEVYKKEFHKGKLKAITGKYKGLSIRDAKEKIIEDFTKHKQATLLYDLMNPVICRCLAPCHVKIVDNQWFLTYSDKIWKQKTMKALQECKLYPEKIRPQFQYVIDWLRDWACTREFGLGTKLPWDENWVIESLSDSTIYMAYYTIAHLLEEVPVEKCTELLFDYIFLNKGNLTDLHLDKKTVVDMKTEFEYWYPVDYRNSAKDLVQNHLAFYLFNHTAIFPEQYWPKGIGVNGYVNVQKMKMSKSKGNFKTMRDLVKAFSPDVTRITILANAEELADVDWDPDFAFNIKARLEWLYQFCLDNYNKETEAPMRAIDKWMESQLHSCIKEATAAMEQTLFRTALNKGFFDLQRHLKWYLRRTAGEYNTQLISDIIEAQLKMLAPFTPHLCEEIWSKLSKTTFIAVESWPAADESKINPSLASAEQAISQAMADIASVIKLAKVKKPEKITLFVAEDWKHDLFAAVKEQLEQTRNPGDIIKTLMQTDLKQHGQVITKLVPKVVKNPGMIPEVKSHQEAEYQFLADSKAFFAAECGCELDIINEQDSKEAKAKQALPGKPAILVK